VLAGCCPHGAAALAAARLAHNCGAEVSVYLLSAEADSCSEFAGLLEVVGAMDLPLRLWRQDQRGADLGADCVLLGGELPEAGQRLPGALDLADREVVQPLEVRGPGSAPETLLHAVTEQTPALANDAVRAIDVACVETYGLPSLCLMENAGLGAAQVAAGLAGEGSVLVVAGKGNNGGDGLVLARELAARGGAVAVALLCEPDELRGDAAANRDLLADTEAELHPCAEAPDRLAALCAERALVVDGILGTGISGEVRGTARAAIEAVNRAGRPVLALDLPSGLDADSGEELGVCIHAAATVTFAAVKTGLRRGAGPARSGELVLADIGAPAALLRQAVQEQ
jgi:NAD(P)H-hydrate epimerase